MSLTAAGATALAAGISAAASLGVAGANYGNSRQARKENYVYNEAAARNAFERQKLMQEILNDYQYKQYYDLESPKAIIQQLKDAGLSPSIYAGGALGGGVSGISEANAPQGAGTSGQSAIPFTMTTGDIADTMVKMAQARKLNADADTTEGKNERGIAEIAKIWADEGYTNAAKALTESNKNLADLEAYVYDKTKSFKIKYAEYLAEEQYENSRKAGYEAEREGWQLKYDEETYNSRLEEQFARVENLITDTLEKQSQIRLNDQQVEGIKQTINESKERILQNWQKVATEKANWRTYDELVAAEIEKMTKESGAIATKLGLEEKKIKMDFIATLIGSAAHLAGCAAK